MERVARQVRDPAAALLPDLPDQRAERRQAAVREPAQRLAAMAVVRASQPEESICPSEALTTDRAPRLPAERRSI